MPSIVYRLLIGTWSQGNLHYMRLHFLKLDREFFCLQPSLARLYSAAASPSERLCSDGSLAITFPRKKKNSLLRLLIKKEILTSREVLYTKLTVRVISSCFAIKMLSKKEFFSLKMPA